MRPVSSFVRDILDESEIALSSFLDGTLNLSAYAKRIQAEVSRRAKKEVAIGTIVVALSRYEIEARKRAPLCPRVHVESISTRSGLSEVTFNKTQANRVRLRELYSNSRLTDAELLTVTSGIAEISLILPTALTPEVLKIFRGETPTLVLENLASLTLRFPSKYIHTPNTTFALLRPLALNRINIVEVVSTYTELTFVVAQANLQAAFSILSEIR